MCISVVCLKCLLTYVWVYAYICLPMIKEIEMNTLKVCHKYQVVLLSWVSDMPVANGRMSPFHSFRLQIWKSNSFPYSPFNLSLLFFFFWVTSRAGNSGQSKYYYEYVIRFFAVKCCHRYMRGRLTLEKVNAAINDIATYAEANVLLIVAPKKKVLFPISLFLIQAPVQS